MINARQELLEHIKERHVKHVKIKFTENFDKSKLVAEGNLEKVLPLLDFDYDDGHGLQELFGYI